MAHRCCVDWLRQLRPLADLVIVPGRTSPGPDEHYAEAEREELAGRVVDEVRPPCRELFRLVAEQELSYAEIAERQQRTPGAVRTQMCQCLKEARCILARLLQAAAANRTEPER